MEEEFKDRYISISEVKEILHKESESETFRYEKREILRHAELFSFLSSEDTKKLIEELGKIDRVNSAHAYKLADILPISEEELRAVFAKEIMSPTEEELKQILDTIKKFV